MELNQSEYIPFHFPWPNESRVRQLGTMANGDLILTLGELLRRRGADGELVSYLDIREEYCAISAVLNCRRMSPPPFRPRRPLPKPVKGFAPSEAETIMLNDRQIIDLHWLHVRGKRDLLDSKEFAELFTSSRLNRTLADIFVSKNWSAQTRATEILRLLDYEQWQMAVLRSKTVADTWRNARKSMTTTINRRLREQAIKEPGLTPHIADLQHLWLANKLAGHLGQKRVGEVYSWLTGQPPLQPSTLSAKLKRMRRRTKVPLVRTPHRSRVTSSPPEFAGITV